MPRSGCDKKSPHQATDCDNDQIVMKSTEILALNGNSAATLYLYTSAHCQTAWGAVKIHGESKRRLDLYLTVDGEIFNEEHDVSVPSASTVMASLRSGRCIITRTVVYYLAAPGHYPTAELSTC